MITLGAFLVGFAAAGQEKGTSNGGTYCEPCNDETLDGIAWTSKNTNNNYEENDANTRRNAIYGVLVKMNCPSGFTGQATRICDGWGIWKPVQWNCKSVACSGPPKWNNPDAQVDNEATAAACKDYSGDKYCDVKCKSNLIPSRSRIMCFGGEWMTKDVSCSSTQGEETANNAEEEKEDGAMESKKIAEEHDAPTSIKEGVAGDARAQNMEESDSFPLVPIAIAGGILVLVVGAGCFVYQSRNNKAGLNVENNSSMMSQSVGSSKHGSKYGSKHGSKQGSNSGRKNRSGLE